MKKTLYKVGLPLLAAFSPIFVFAAGKTLRDIIQIIIGYFSVLMVLIIGLAVLTFVWNIYKYFFRPEQDRKESGMYVLFATIGFFVILSFWGLVNILSNTFNLDNSAPAWWPFTNSGGTTQSGSFPNNSSSGSFPNNSYTGSFPNNSSSGSFPNNSSSGSFPNNSSSGSLPNNSSGSLPNNSSSGNLPNNSGIAEPWDH